MTVGVRVGVSVRDGVSEGVSVRAGEGVLDAVGVGETMPGTTMLGEGVLVGLGVFVNVGLAVAVKVGVGVGASVRSNVPPPTMASKMIVAAMPINAPQLNGGLVTGGDALGVANCQFEFAVRTGCWVGFLA